MKKGVPISPGVVVAPGFRLDAGLGRRTLTSLDAAAVSGELTRFEQACQAAAAELDVLIERVRREIGEEEAAIFRAHRLLTRDPALIGKVKSFILQQHLDAPSALQETLDEFSQLFGQIADAYLRERLSDIRDVVQRIMNHLSIDQMHPLRSSTEPVILVTEEILPSQAVMFERLPIAGIATQTGGSTSHAAILARALGIPAVSDLSGLLQEVKTGDLLILDGRDGHVLVHPGPEVEAAYRKLAREYVDLRDRLIENRDAPAVTADGVELELLANINSVADAHTATNVGATGVGLYRTEYLFLTHPGVPDEAEQCEVYRSVIQAAPHQRVTIRTLDLGGDKQVPYFGAHRESNPFMGWRSIRLTVAFPEFFQTQLKAIFRAGTTGEVSVLFPMVSTLEEVRRVKKIVERTRLALQHAGIPHHDRIPLGIMVEVPAAAVCIDQLLEEVDFVSIGSNDLIQYVMAADRDNPKVAHLCEPFQPAVFRMLKQIIAACHQHGKPVTLCGEMAGRPRCLLPLVGMGLRRFSMSPAFVPTLKEITRCMTLPQAWEATRQVLRLRLVEEIRDYLSDQLQRVCPNVAVLDTH